MAAAKPSKQGQTPSTPPAKQTPNPANTTTPSTPPGPAQNSAASASVAAVAAAGKGAKPTTSGTAASQPAAASNQPNQTAAAQKPGAKPAAAAPGSAPQTPGQTVASNPVAKTPVPEPQKPPEKNPEKSASAPPLKPFIAAAPAPSTTQPTGSWKMLGPGKQTQGRSVTAEQASSLQGRNDSAPIYLHGKFVVTAAGGNRAVLRTNSNSPTAPKARVIVEYPAGGVPPQQGASIAREDGRGFEIREVRRTPDGQVNIYVREVTSQ
jgi:hypothetical protein